MTKSESLKNRYKQIVWTDFVQVYTNINYSSLYCEQLREKQLARYFWGIYLCMGIPTMLSILLKMGYITNATIVFPKYSQNSLNASKHFSAENAKLFVDQ